MTEYYDIYGSDAQPLGVALPADEVHKRGLWHRIFVCAIIFRAQDGTDYIVLQRRSEHKRVHPGIVTPTVAGHYRSGEDVMDGLREVSEEIGIEISFDRLIPLGRGIATDDAEGVRERTFQDWFLLIDDRPLSTYRLAPDEVSELIQVRVDDGLALWGGEVAEIRAQACRARNEQAPLEERELILTVNDFAYSVDRYIYRLFVLAKRALAGEKHLAI